MADVTTPTLSQPRPIAGAPFGNGSSQPLLPPSVSTLRSGHLTLDTLSPVNQNGSFEFDRVIRAGEVMKRTRKTKSWKPIYIVLRPNLLSIYRDATETKLRHQITLSDLTAVARQRDPKARAKYVFGLFSPSRNYHLEARSDKDAQEWVELIRREARIDEDEEEIVLASPNGHEKAFTGFERRFRPKSRSRREDTSTAYSSSEAEGPPRSTPSRKTTHPMNVMHSARRPSHTLEYSGPENVSFSDFSDSAGPTAHMSTLSLAHPDHLSVSARDQPSSTQTMMHGGSSQASAAIGSAYQTPHAPKVPQQQDGERVVCQGWIYFLKSKSGVRQWKKSWMVLRAKGLAVYKNEEEYSAVLVLPFGGIINAVEIDPISHSKTHCWQIITEEKNYRMCAPDEDNLAKWLGAFKSLIVKRKEAQMQKSSATRES